MSTRYRTKIVIKLFPSIPKGLFGGARLTRWLERNLFYRDFQVEPWKLALTAGALALVGAWGVLSLVLSLHAVGRAERLREQVELREGDIVLREQAVRVARRDQYLLLARLGPMNRKVERLATFSQKLAVVAGIDDLAADLGTTVEQRQASFDLSKSTVDELERRFERLGTFIENQEFELARTPSISPLKDSFVPTDRFGLRHNRMLRQAAGEAVGGNGMQFHAGLDLAAPVGTPIHATADGEVHFAGRIPAKQSAAAAPYGNFLVLDHGNGIRTVYAHCDQLAVAAGDSVQRGNVIGWVGSTGRSTGPHVHYEVVVDGRPLDPEVFILDRPIPRKRVPVEVEDHPSLADEVDKLMAAGA